MAGIGDVLQVAWKVVVGMGIFAGSMFGFIRLCAYVRSVAKARLNPFEKELLVAAVDNGGEIARFASDQMPDWIRIGAKDYTDDTAPSVAARYIQALEKLIERGYVTHVGGCLYELTGRGWDLGRKYKCKRARGA